MVFRDFNLEPTNPVMINFMNSQNFSNLIKDNICFKGVGSCIDLTLTNRKYCFKNTSASEEPKKFVYRGYNDLMSKTVEENVDYSKFEKEFIDTLNKTCT